MDLGLTWRGDYVMRSATELARRHAGGAWSKATDLAAATGIPAGYIRQILRLLVGSGIAEARAGTQGGYRLRRDPASITVLDVVEIAEGDLSNGRCVIRGSACSPRRPCTLHPVISRAQAAFRDTLDEVTLAEVIAPRGAREGVGAAGRAR